MARSAVLPLPDPAVRHILGQIDALRAAFPPSQGSRPFLAAFVRLVYEATGNVFGAGVMRKLLQTYASEYRPSTVTLHDEIKAFKEELQGIQAPRQGASDRGQRTTDATLPGVQSVMAGIERLLAQARPGEADPYRDVLLQALQAENARIRNHNEYLQDAFQTCQATGARMATDVQAIRAERDAKASAVSEMAEQVSALAQAVEKAQEQVAASHRFAMGRIEDASAETRLWKERYRQAQTEINALKKHVESEKEATQAYRRALNDRRSAGHE